MLQVLGMGPHRLSAESRPAWFFEHERYGGILCDIGSHQIEQYLYYSGEKDARVVRSQVANYNHPQYPELEDFGDCTPGGRQWLYQLFRVDWFTPDGLSTWGTAAASSLGTDGYIEIRKYVDVAHQPGGDHVSSSTGTGAAL